MQNLSILVFFPLQSRYLLFQSDVFPHYPFPILSSSIPPSISIVPPQHPSHGYGVISVCPSDWSQSKSRDAFSLHLRAQSLRDCLLMTHSDADPVQPLLLSGIRYTAPAEWQNAEIETSHYLPCKYHNAVGAPEQCKHSYFNMCMLLFYACT